MRKLILLLRLPLLALDCLGSVLVGESFGATLSAKAYDVNVKQQPWWGWARGFIDALFSFQPDHCKAQWERERKYGSVWKAWAADWKGK